MLRFENVATPATAETVAEPDREPPFGLSRIATVTLAVDDVTTLPPASRIDTFTAGAIVTPATASDGSTVKARWSADPAVTLKDDETAPVSPVAVACSV